jgi:hypothetical protein
MVGVLVSRRIIFVVACSVDHTMYGMVHTWKHIRPLTHVGDCRIIGTFILFASSDSLFVMYRVARGGTECCNR